MVKQYHNVTLAVPPDRLEEFNEKLNQIMEITGIKNSVSGAIIEFILTSDRILFEAERYRRMMEDAMAYESLYDKKHNKSKYGW